MYDDLRGAEYRKRIYLEMSFWMKFRLVGILLAIVVVPALAGGLLRNHIWCTDAKCSMKDWLELLAFSFTIPGAILTLEELALGESGLLRMLRTGKARVTDLNTFTKVTGLSRNSFWSLALQTSAHKIVKSSSPKEGSTVKFLKPLKETDSRSPSHHDIGRQLISPDVLNDLLISAIMDDLRSTKYSSERGSFYQSIAIGDVRSDELEHLIIIDLNECFVATANRCRKIRRNHRGNWRFELEAAETEISYNITPERTITFN